MKRMPDHETMGFVSGPNGRVRIELDHFRFVSREFFARKKTPYRCSDLGVVGGPHGGVGSVREEPKEREPLG